MRPRLAFLALVLLAAGTARADVIDPGSRPVCEDVLECPEGSSPVSLGHSSCPSVCRPNAECRSDAECGEGERCVPTRFCIVTAYSGPGMSESVADACEPSGPCGAGAAPGEDPPRCVEVSRCAAPPPPHHASAPARGGCAGCVVAKRGAAELAPLAIVLLTMAHRRRLASSGIARFEPPE